jgi:hypothetical protein
MGSMSTSDPHDLNELLPWYANHTLAPDEQRAVEAWLQADPASARRLATWQQIQSAAVSQLQVAPSPAVRQKLMARIQARHQARQIRWAWVWGTAMAALVLMVLWLVVQPGIALQWSVDGGHASQFRIYRAVNGGRDFNLLNEVPAQPNIRDYTFTDTSSLPGQHYTYLVEAIGASGRSILSQTVTGDGLDALPSQLLLLLVSLLAGYAVMFIAPAIFKLAGPGRPLGV